MDDDNETDIMREGDVAREREIGTRESGRDFEDEDV